MGNKESKPTVLPYEEAVRRVSDEELKRLRDAFKRYSLPSGFMSRPVFVKDVLGDCVPVKLGEHLYYAFGGSNKGIVFKELVCGLVLLTKGKQIEKIKFIFQLCANETGMHVNRDDLQKFIIACDGGPIPIEVKQLFRGADYVSYEQFCSWLLNHTGVMKISSWLLEDTQHKGLRLTDDGDTPTFYQTLAGVTHLEEVDIIELEKKYWMLQAQSKTGRFDLETFTPLISPPVPKDLCKGLFHAFDENHDEHIDLKEMACGLSACCRGPLAERQKFCFKIFDKNHDGLLDRQELESMCTSLVNIRKELRVGMEIDYEKIERLNPIAIAGDILAAHDGDEDGSITPEEYQMWTVKSSLPDDFCNLLFEVCHVVLGLRPASRDEEKQVVLGWIDREKRRGLQMGTTWYLIAIDWWRLWNKYVNYNPKTANHATTSQTKSSTLPRNIHSNAQAWSTRPGGSPNFPRRSTGSKSESSRSSLAGLSPTSSPRRSGSSLAGFSPTGSPRNSANYSPRKGAYESSGVPLVPSKPGPINNTPLVVQDPKKVPVLTNEGGRLKRSLNPIIGREFEIIPDPVWKALYQWYAGGPILPRNVITPTKGDKSSHLELHPLNVKLLRHQSNTPKQGGLSIGSGGISWNNSSSTNNATTTPKRYLAYTASFSKMHTMQQVHEFLCARLRVRVEEMRLWSLKDENNPVLLEDEPVVLEELKIVDDQQMLIEIRNKDLSWPEEMSLLAKNKLDKHKQVHTESGVTGLSNLGNTCFLNSALQCISNTQPLTMYFKSECYLYELNSSNPLGMKGHIARRYGELVNDLWAGNAKSIAPLKLRWTIAKYAPRFNGFQQQDSQELLAFLLDGLHEDLNRVHDKPYVELKDSDSRPDEEVAKEAWENHLRRNKSIVVDLFHGQLKSQVRCKTCGHVSVRFDPFTFLSLPLPMDSSMHVEIIVVKLNGSVPMKYGLRLNMDDKYRVFKGKLSELCNIPSDQLLLVEIGSAMIRGFPSESQKIRTLLGGILYAYEVPAPPPDAICSKLSPDVTTPTQIGSPTSPSTSLPPINTTNADSLAISPTQSQTQSPTSTPKSIQVSSQATPNGSIHQSKPNGKVPGVNSSNAPVRQHSRNPSNASSVGQSPTQTQPLEWTLIAMQRKMMRMDVYFLGWQKSRPALFGTPLILSNHEGVTNCELYDEVWTQVKRLVSSPPPSEVNNGNKNHAEDGSRQFYPYTLKAVQKDGLTCAWCPWYRFCRGCEIVCDSLKFNHGTAYIAVDWEPTALHLRYQSSQERVVKDHESVEKSHKLQTEPIDLDECLRAFTKEEELGEDELYYCSKCKDHRLAAKKLEIWRLPPILIVHMKRFQFVNGRWIKSQKIVKFPKEEFDPSNFLAAREIPQTPLLPVTPKKPVPESGVEEKVNKVDDKQDSANNVETIQKLNPTLENGHAMPSPVNQKTCIRQKISAEGDGTELNGVPSDSENNAITLDRHDLEELKIRTSPSHSFSSDHSNDSKSGNLSPLVDATNDHPLIFNLPPEASNGGVPEKPDGPMYDLFAVSCHTGILGGGHYVSYAINPNKKWYCFNDSSVKEVKGDIDTDHAYLLFYERKNLPYRCFIPDISGKIPDRSPIDDEIDADYKKFCVIQ